MVNRGAVVVDCVVNVDRCMSRFMDKKMRHFFQLYFLAQESFPCQALVG
jgi:hypothetical protein